jgi:hypothetical protein
MSSRFLSITVALILAGAALAEADGDKTSTSRRQPPAPRVYEGRIKDVRPAVGMLILTMGKGKQARDLRFNISEARIVGLFGAEWKGEDLNVGDRVRVQMTADGALVQQVRVLPNRTSGRNKPIR